MLLAKNIAASLVPSYQRALILLAVLEKVCHTVLTSLATLQHVRQAVRNQSQISSQHFSKSAERHQAQQTAASPTNHFVLPQTKQNPNPANPDFFSFFATYQRIS